MFDLTPYSVYKTTSLWIQWMVYLATCCFHSKIKL